MDTSSDKQKKEDSDGKAEPKPPRQMTPARAKLVAEIKAKQAAAKEAWLERVAARTAAKKAAAAARGSSGDAEADAGADLSESEGESDGAEGMMDDGEDSDDGDMMADADASG